MFTKHSSALVGQHRAWRTTHRLSSAVALLAILTLTQAQTDPSSIQAQQQLQSDQAAAQTLHQLATAGDAASQFQLSLLYRTGRGVPADARQSLQWLRRAAAGNYPEALSNLGGEYAKGQMLAQDKVRALALFYLAQAAGLSEAGTNAQVVARNLTPAQVAQGQDLALRCTREGLPLCL